MKNYRLPRFPIVLVFISFLFKAYSQKGYQVTWFNKDLSPYSTYMVKEYKVNHQIINYKEDEDYKGAARFMDSFNKNMSKLGLEVQEKATLGFLFDIKLDTLPQGFQRPEGASPEDRIVDLKLTIEDSEVNEILMEATFNTLTKDPKKLNKEVKGMIYEFFKEAKIN
ncbi:MAG: hypothetical protein AAF620_20225 [Bacteroidota bacterium]